MKKIDRILTTEIRDFKQGDPINKRMTKQQIRYNTDVVFAVAKRMDKPLDQTASMMLNKNEFKRLYNSYKRRNSVSANTIVEHISQALEVL